MSKTEEKKTPLTNIEKVDRVFKFLPFILLLAGGVIGGVCGALGWQLNEYVFKKEMSRTLKYITAIFILILSYCFLLLATVILIFIFPNLVAL